MDEVKNAIEASNERKQRLINALGTTAVSVKSPATTGAELHHLEQQLVPHGLSIATLLRSVAQHFHGVSVPNYNPSNED